MPVCKVTNKRDEALAADLTDNADACCMLEGGWQMVDGRWLMADVTQISQISQINW